jgi:hypothetical protein
MRRGLAYALGPAAREATLLLMERSFDPLALEYEGNEHGFAASMLVGGQTRETVSAVNQFFNDKFQKKFACSSVAMVKRRIADQRQVKATTACIRRAKDDPRRTRKMMMIRVRFACFAVRPGLRSRFRYSRGKQGPGKP